MVLSKTAPFSVHLGREAMDNYSTAAQMAANWGISERYVQMLCKQNRIPNAQKFGGVWLIPSSAKKPKKEKTGRKPSVVQEGCVND